VVSISRSGSQPSTKGPAEEWADKVYRPDIEAKWDAVYKKPGYRM
jgi:hypothetical protein